MEKYGNKNTVAGLDDFCNWAIQQGGCSGKHCDGCYINEAKNVIREYMTGEVTLHITDIVWDMDRCDGEVDNGDKDVQLPNEIVCNFDYCEDSDEFRDNINDWLYEKYGFCTKSFTFEFVDTN